MSEIPRTVRAFRLCTNRCRITVSPQVRGAIRGPQASTRVQRRVAASAVTVRSRTGQRSQEATMAWARKRTTADGNLTFRGYYRDPDGRTRSAGSFPSSRAALRAAAREQGKVSDGTWLDPTLGKITFRDFVETVDADRAVGAGCRRAFEAADGAARADGAPVPGDARRLDGPDP